MKVSLSTFFTILILLSVVAVVTLYTWQSQSRKQTDAISNSEAVSALSDEHTYTTVDDVPIKLSQYIGSGVVVVNSWASWCPFCVSELPDFSTLAAEYKDQGVTIIAINRNESVKIVKQFLDSIGNPAGVVFALDKTDTFYKKIGGFTMPETVFYDKDGNVVAHKRGFMDLSQMREQVKSALEASK